MGCRFNADVLAQTRALFSEGWDPSLGVGARLVRDLRYSDHARQTLDLFVPAGQGHAIVVYVPGGGFTGGDKAGYSHIGAWFCRQGFLTAIMNYRLAPEYRWPSGSEDVASAIGLLARQARAYGGDPSRIFVIGQSAGATHTAGALLEARDRTRPFGGVRRLILLSGVYGVDETLNHPGVRAYFGNDPSSFRSKSTVSQLVHGHLPIHLAVAEFDLPFVVKSAFDLASASMAQEARCPPISWMGGHNHVSAVLAMGTASDQLGHSLAQSFND